MTTGIPERDAMIVFLVTVGIVFILGNVTGAMMLAKLAMKSKPGRVGQKTKRARHLDVTKPFPQEVIKSTTLPRANNVHIGLEPPQNTIKTVTGESESVTPRIPVISGDVTDWVER